MEKEWNKVLWIYDARLEPVLVIFEPINESGLKQASQQL